MAAASTHSDAATNEKADVDANSPVVQHQKPKKGFFSKKDKRESTEVDEKAADVALEAPKEVKKEVPPASFSSLFRYAPLVATVVFHCSFYLDSLRVSNCSWMRLAWSVRQQEELHRYAFPYQSVFSF